MNHWPNDNFIINDTYIRMIITKPRYREQACLRRYEAEAEYQKDPNSGYWEYIIKIINTKEFRMKAESFPIIMPLISYYGLEGIKIIKDE